MTQTIYLALDHFDARWKYKTEACANIEFYDSKILFKDITACYDTSIIGLYQKICSLKWLIFLSSWGLMC